MSYTNPTFMAVRTATSGTHDIARRRALKMYRDYQRCVPDMVNLYQMELPVSTVRSKVRQEFERHRYISDLPTIDVILFKGQAEYQEINNFWKQQSHVMKYFTMEDEPQSARAIPNTFMGRFLEGRN